MGPAHGRIARRGIYPSQMQFFWIETAKNWSNNTKLWHLHYFELFGSDVTAIIGGVVQQLDGVLTWQSTIHSMGNTSYSLGIVFDANGCPHTTIFEILLPLIHWIDWLGGRMAIDWTSGMDGGANYFVGWGGGIFQVRGEWLCHCKCH